MIRRETEFSRPALCQSQIPVTPSCEDPVRQTGLAINPSMADHARTWGILTRILRRSRYLTTAFNNP